MSVVASAIVNGTFRSRASVSASSVLPQPVGPDQQDVALGELDLVLVVAMALVAWPRLQALVVVVDRDREDLLGAVLADHVLVEDFADLVGLRQAVARPLLLLLELLADDVVAEFDALVADENRGAGDELAHLVLALAAEGAIEQLAVVVLAPRVVDHASCPSFAGRPAAFL